MEAAPIYISIVFYCFSIIYNIYIIFSEYDLGNRKYDCQYSCEYVNQSVFHLFKGTESFL